MANNGLPERCVHSDYNEHDFKKLNWMQSIAIDSLKDNGCL